MSKRRWINYLTYCLDVTLMPSCCYFNLRCFVINIKLLFTFQFNMKYSIASHSLFYRFHLFIFETKRLISLIDLMNFMMSIFIEWESDCDFFSMICLCFIQSVPQVMTWKSICFGIYIWDPSSFAKETSWTWNSAVNLFELGCNQTLTKFLFHVEMFTKFIWLFVSWLDATHGDTPSVHLQ